MRKHLDRLFLMLCAILLVTSTSYAQPSASNDKEGWFKDHTARKNRKNLSGWRGIVFICAKGEGVEGKINDVCRRIGEDAAFLAASSKVRFVIARSYEDFFLNIWMENLLPLTADLTFTKAESSPAAVYVHLKSSISFSEAVEYKEARKIVDNQNISPRAGDLVLWERSLIGASSGNIDSLVTPISRNVEQLLKIFFTDYLNAQK